MSTHKSKYRRQLTELGAFLDNATGAVYGNFDGLPLDVWETLASFFRAAESDVRVRAMLELAPSFCGLNTVSEHGLRGVVNEWLEDPEATIRNLWESCAEAWDDYGNELPMPAVPELDVTWQWPGSGLQGGRVPADNINGAVVDASKLGDLDYPADCSRPCPQK